MNRNPIELTLVPTPKQFQLLTVKLNRTLNLDDLLTVDVPEFDESKGLIISGRGPIWLYLFLYSKINNIPWIAQYDPRFGAVVLQSSEREKFLSKISLAEIISYLPQMDIKPEIIAFLGPPHSGKSVFMYLLYKSLLKENFNHFYESSFIIKASPDGEGVWSSETSLDVVQMVCYKNKFTTNFVKNVIKQIKNISKTKSLIFVDCGGKMDKHNQNILMHCTSAIFLATKKEIIKEWKSYFNTVNAYAEVISIKGGAVNVCKKRKDNTLELKMHNLSRGNSDIVIPKNFIQSFIKR